MDDKVTRQLNLIKKYKRFIEIQYLDQGST